MSSKAWRNRIIALWIPPRIFEAGVDEKTAQIWLGHADPKRTRDLYAQLRQEIKARSAEALIDYLKNK